MGSAGLEVSEVGASCRLCMKAWPSRAASPAHSSSQQPSQNQHLRSHQHLKPRLHTFKWDSTGIFGFLFDCHGLCPWWDPCSSAGTGPVSNKPSQRTWSSPSPLLESHLTAHRQQLSFFQSGFMPNSLCLSSKQRLRQKGFSFPNSGDSPWVCLPSAQAGLGVRHSATLVPPPERQPCVLTLLSPKERRAMRASLCPPCVAPGTMQDD